MKTNQLSFANMWKTIVSQHGIRKSHFGRELIACIFWEESGFVYSALNPGSGALGFGQVLPSNIDKVNTRFKTGFTKQGVLLSAEDSCAIALLTLELCWEWKQGSRDKALDGYSGYPLNQDAVRRWKLAEAELLKASLTAEENQSFNQEQIIKALKLCSQPGWDPAEVFP